MSRFEFNYHTDLNLIELAPSGVVEISDIVAYAREILSLDILSEGTVEYYNLPKMTNIRGDFESAYGLTGLLREWISRGWKGSVFFTPREHQFGMIRMIGSILESIQEEPDVVMIPRCERIPLSEVRDLITAHLQKIHSTTKKGYLEG